MERRVCRPTRPYTVWIVVCALLLLGCLGMALWETRDHRAGGEAYGALAVKAVTVRAQQVVTLSTQAEEAPAAGTAETEAAPQPEQAPIAVDFSALEAVDGRVAGWLYGEGTALNYPVVAGTDNAYYLNHLPDGTRNASGTLFVDCENAPGFSDRNTVIHGHHMKNGSMFGALERYREQSYYEAHPRLYLLTEAGDYRLDLVAGYTTRAGGEGYEKRFADEAAFLSFVERARAQSDFAAPVAVSAGDRLVTLSTCAYAFANARYILLARLVPLF